MEIDRILCPIDFSENNHAANDYASALAKSSGARIIYLHAYIPDVYANPPAHFDADKEYQRVQEKLEAFVKPTEEDVQASYVVESGKATDAIVRYAGLNDIDLVVMGTHGRSGATRLVMGSVAESVVRHAKNPVLTVKSEADLPQDK